VELVIHSGRTQAQIARELDVSEYSSFGLFSPPNATITAVLFLCAVAVAGAIQTILDLSRPFEGVIRVSGHPLRHPLDVINH
jgi:hypothetical protein